MKEIPLTRGYVALVDDEDFARIAPLKWHYLAAGPGYARMYTRKEGGKDVYTLLHRFILDASPGTVVDHRNRNGLDCRRDNLRLCSYKENAHNRAAFGASRYKGVSFSKSSNRWRAAIEVGGVRKYLGAFHTEVEASAAYNAAATELFGEFAYLNAA